MQTCHKSLINVFVFNVSVVLTVFLYWQHKWVCCRITVFKHIKSGSCWTFGSSCAVTRVAALHPVFTELLQHAPWDLVLTLWNEGVKGHISCLALSLSHRRGQAEQCISSVRTSDTECLPPRSDGAAPEDKDKVSERLHVWVTVSERELLVMFVCVHLVQHCSGVCCRQTEASSGLCDRCGWKAHDHHANFPLQHFSSESPDQRQKIKKRWRRFAASPHHIKIHEETSSFKSLIISSPFLQRAVN